MPKRPTNGEDKNIQLELLPTEQTKATLNAAKVTRNNFIRQAGIIAKLYVKLDSLINSNDLSIDDIKKAGDTMRNLGIWNKNFWEGMSLVEQKEAEKVIALGIDERLDIASMTEEELDAALAARINKNKLK